jgi:hypothetical protein
MDMDWDSPAFEWYAQFQRSDVTYHAIEHLPSTGLKGLIMERCFARVDMMNGTTGYVWVRAYAKHMSGIIFLFGEQFTLLHPEPAGRNVTVTGLTTLKRPSDQQLAANHLACCALPVSCLLNPVIVHLGQGPLSLRVQNMPVYRKQY